MTTARRPLISLLLAVSALAAPTALRAATHVVDNANPEAADSNPGSETKPWKTIQHAADKAAPGDTVFVCEGTYIESVTLKNSGADGKWITFKSAPRRTAQLAGFNTGNTQFVRLEGFRVVNADKTAKGGINVANSDHIDIVDNYIENAGTGIAGGRTLMDEARGHSPLAIRIVHNEIYHVQFGIIAAGTKWLLESNEIHRLFDYGLADDDDYTRAFGEGHEYRFNFFHGSKVSEIGKSHVDIIQFFDNNGEYVKDLFIHDNVFTDFHQGLMGEMHHPGHAANLTFRQNIYYTSDPWGAWGLCDEDIPGVVADRNTFYGIQWFGVGIKGEGATGGIIRNNIFQKIDQAIQITKDKKKNETLVEGNILVDIKHKNEHGAADKVDVDPRMVDPANGNFRLAKGSPAIKGGTKGETVGALDYPNVYYVDPQHPAATDEAFGYAGRPFKTLAKAVAVARPGETILLRAGIYREELKPTTDGITIRAVEGDSVILSGADLIDGWKKDAAHWTVPTKLLKDGQSFPDLKYDPATKKVTLPTGDLRIHLWETITREHAIDLSGVKNATLENLKTTNTLAAPIVPGQGNTIK